MSIGPQMSKQPRGVQCAFWGGLRRFYDGGKKELDYFRLSTLNKHACVIAGHGWDGVVLHTAHEGFVFWKRTCLRIQEAQSAGRLVVQVLPPKVKCRSRDISAYTENGWRVSLLSSWLSEVEPADDLLRTVGIPLLGGA